MVARRLKKPCIRIGTHSDLVWCRAYPSKIPSAKIEAISWMPYCTWITAQSADVTTIVPATPNADRDQPANRKPRNSASSTSGATTIVENANNRGASAMVSVYSLHHHVGS